MEGEHNRIDVPKIFPNPENPLEIKFPFFEGPLDLLLHLIRIKEVSIEEVRLSELTTSYLEYVEIMHSINLDLAGEFLEIAAMLILIKSRHLLPRAPEDLEEIEEEDPEEIHRPENVDLVGDSEEEDPEYEDISVSTLMEAFERVMKRLPKQTRHLVEAETVRIEDRIEEMILILMKKQHCLFEELFAGDKSKLWFIITFMALLEMARLRLITIVQVEQHSASHWSRHEHVAQNIIDWYILQKGGEQEESAMLKAS